MRSTSFTVLGQGQTDGDGRFRLDSPRTSSTRVFEVVALAAAPGFGLGWVELNPDAEQPAADIRLQPEQIVRVRLVDVSGRPAGGVEVTVIGHRTRERQGHFDGVSPLDEPARGHPRLAAPVKTDDQGQDRPRRDRPRRARRACVVERPAICPARPRTSIRPRRRADKEAASRSSRPGSSRGVCWPPTPASRSRMPSSRPRPWS